MLYSFKYDNDKYIYSPGQSQIYLVDDLTYQMAKEYETLPRRDMVNKYSPKNGQRAVIQSYGWISQMAAASRPIKIRDHRISLDKIKKSLKDIRTYDLYVTDTCNLHCEYCYLADSFRKKPIGRMEWEVADKALDLLFAQAKSKKITIRFPGGEPLLNFGVIKSVVEKCKRFSRDHKIQFRFVLTSNATLLTEKIFRYLARKKVQLDISLDGNQAIQDAFRKFPDGRGTYELIRKNIKRMQQWDRKYLKTINFLSVITPGKQSIVERMQFLNKFGGLGVRFSQLKPTKRFKLDELSARQLKKYQAEYNAYLTRKMLSRDFKKMNRDLPYRQILFKLLIEQGGYRRCLAGLKYLAVDVNGQLYPCMFLAGAKRFAIGHVNRAIDLKKIRRFYAEYDRAIKQCRNCWAVYLCGVRCPYQQGRTGHSFHRPKESACRNMKRAILKAFQYYLGIKNQDPSLFDEWQKYEADKKNYPVNKRLTG